MRVIITGDQQWNYLALAKLVVIRQVARHSARPVIGQRQRAYPGIGNSAHEGVGD